MLLLVVFSSGCIETEEPPKPTDGSLCIQVFNEGYQDQWVMFFVNNFKVDRKYVKVNEYGTWVGLDYEFGTYQLAFYAEVSKVTADEDVTISEDDAYGYAGWTFR